MSETVPPIPRPGRAWGTALARAWGFASLRTTRARARAPLNRAAGVLVGSVVAIASILVGGMLTLLPTQGAYTVELITGGGPSAWWFYPEVLVVQPWGIAQFPWFPTAAMALVAIGAALGTAASVGAVRRWLAEGRSAGSLAGIAAGTGPSLASIATVGACCCTSCASSAGLALVAAASATTVSSLYQTEWYLPVVQLAIVYLSLLAQERALRTPPVPVASRTSTWKAETLRGALRVALLIAGATWSLAMFVEWGTVDPWTASAATWYHWLFEHQLLGIVAMAAALFPNEFTRGVHAFAHRAPGMAVRLGLGIAGLTWGVGVPPLLAQAGLGGFGNELLGAFGVPPALGGVAPDVPVGAALVFHWTFQHLLLAGFALTVAVAPHAAARSVAAGASTGAADPSGSTREIRSVRATEVGARMSLAPDLGEGPGVHHEGELDVPTP